MQLSSKLKDKNLGALTTMAFYALVGVIFFIMLPLSGFPPHIGLLGITSIVAAYGLFKKRFWAIWLVAVLFFVANTFGVYTLLYVVGIDALATVTMFAYVILTWIFTIYAVTHRKPAEE